MPDDTKTFAETSDGSKHGNTCFGKADYRKEVCQICPELTKCTQKQGAKRETKQCNS